MVCKLKRKNWMRKYVFNFILSILVKKINSFLSFFLSPQIRHLVFIWIDQIEIFCCKRTVTVDCKLWHAHLILTTSNRCTTEYLHVSHLVPMSFAIFQHDKMCPTRIARKADCTQKRHFYKYKTSTHTPIVKPCDTLNLAVQNVFYIQL